MIPSRSRPALLLALLLAPGLALPLAAWDNHSLLTRASFRDGSLVSGDVAAEPLEDFLAADPAAVAAALDRAEKRAITLLPEHRKLPAALAFDPAARGPALRASFLRALRVNPTVPLLLFLEPAPGAPPSGRPSLAMGEVSLIGATLAGGPFESLSPGESVPALEVLATASDEPDFGLDVGLYEDNGSPWGKEYGFGIQPWGNPALSYGSQAPFHMAFPAESGIIKLAASFSKRSNAAYRDLQYEELSRLAFSTGHWYWGLRFGGWALHYVQDLGQPWHARMIPGRGSMGIVLLNVFGSAKAKAGEIVLLSNRHLLLESFAFGALTSSDASGSRAVLELALSGSSAAAPPPEPWRELRVYDLTAARAYAAGPSLDRLLAASFPKRYANDPSFDYGLAKEEGRDSYAPWRDLLAESPEAAATMVEALGPLFGDIGADGRDLLGSLMGEREAQPRLKGGRK